MLLAGLKARQGYIEDKPLEFPGYTKRIGVASSIYMTALYIDLVPARQ